MKTQTAFKFSESVPASGGNAEISGKNRDGNEKTAASSAMPDAQKTAAVSGYSTIRRQCIYKSVFKRPNLLL